MMMTLPAIILRRLMINLCIVVIAVCAVIAAESNETVVQDHRPNVEKPAPKQDRIPGWSVTF